MSGEQVKLDDDGIPVLENPLAPEQPARPPAEPAGPDLADQEALLAMMQKASVQQLLDDLSEDLQKLVSWKIESLLKEQISQLIQQAAADSAPKLAEDIRTQLQLALPGLIAKLVEQSRDPDQP